MPPITIAIAAPLLALALGSTGNVIAAPAEPGMAQMIEQIRQLGQRMEALEQRNAQLERELARELARRSALRQNQPEGAPGALSQRLEVLEKKQLALDAGLDSERLSENEPDLSTRLKAVEIQSLNMQKAARKVDALDGVNAGMSLTTVAQKPYANAGNSQLNYRGDMFVSLPLGKIGNIEQKAYVQFRLGQGNGVAVPAYSKPNASLFSRSEPEDAAAVLAQAWYQASIPLSADGLKAHAREALEVNFGKMDPFVFFDQNAVANDETRQFLNAAFVHNPLLDAGGDIGVDNNGFAPGLRLSYANWRAKPQTWGVSLGVFGAGAHGSNYQRSLSAPMVLAQAQTEQRFFAGLPGNYRLYAWRNGQGAHFDESIGTAERHTGWGVSVDQRFGDGLTLFGRYGKQMQGHVRFDRALTVGADWNGSYWNRAADGVGLALGWLKTSRAYADFSGVGGAERVAELYYRFRVGKQFELSPDFQYIDHLGGGSDAIKVLGLRAQINY